MNTNLQCFNPILPSWEYVPDGEPYVFGDRIYVFGSHDRFNGHQFCLNDYVCWSAPVDNLANWRFEGTIFRKEQDPYWKEGMIIQAPDVQVGPDGRYYLYYTLGIVPFISVAVCDSPAGQYQFYGIVHHPDGTPAGSKPGDVFQFDPGVFRDDDGKIYLYSGFSIGNNPQFAEAAKKFQMKGGYAAQLEEDMLTLKTQQTLIVPTTGYDAGTGFEGHGFFEASSMRKIRGKYYFIYSSVLSHELCYAVSDYPDKDFQFGGTLVSIGDVGLDGRTEPVNYLGNTHGSLVEIKNKWYIFYHRQTNRHNYSRQACAEEITFTPDGHFLQAEITSCGLNGGPLRGAGMYEARIACNLRSKNGALAYGTAGTPEAKDHPYFTQSGQDRECNGDQYIANMQDGATAGFKYFTFDHPRKISITTSGDGDGYFSVSLADGGAEICRVALNGSGEINQEISGTHGLYFTYCGIGSINFHSYEIS